jgi:hypothetical protein
MLDKLLNKFQLYQTLYTNLTGDTAINLFWLDMGISKTDLADYIENRLKENKLQIELELRDVGLTEEMASVLKNSIDNFRKTKDKSVT